MNFLLNFINLIQRDLEILTSKLEYDESRRLTLAGIMSEDSSVDAIKSGFDNAIASGLLAISTLDDIRAKLKNGINTTDELLDYYSLMKEPLNARNELVKYIDYNLNSSLITIKKIGDRICKNSEIISDVVNTITCHCDIIIDYDEITNLNNEMSAIPCGAGIYNRGIDELNHILADSNIVRSKLAALLQKLADGGHDWAIGVPMKDSNL